MSVYEVLRQAALARRELRVERPLARALAWALDLGKKKNVVMERRRLVR